MKPARLLFPALLFVLPAACTLPAPPAGEPAQEVAIALVRNQVLVQARLQDSGPYSCLVDTGANPSVIDLALARTLQLRLSAESGAAEGVGTGAVQLRSTEFDVAVGSVQPVRIAAVAVDLGALARSFGRPIHCILGQSWIAPRVLEFDYPRERLRFAASSRRPEDCSVMPMRFWMDDDLMPLVVVQVNGHDVPVSLDTGSSGVLKLFPAEASSAGVENEPARDAPASVTGVRGRAAITWARARSLQFGPLALADARVAVGERNQGEPPGRGGNLGNAMLRQGVLTLDYPARRIRVCAAR